MFDLEPKGILFMVSNQSKKMQLRSKPSSISQDSKNNKVLYTIKNSQLGLNVDKKVKTYMHINRVLNPVKSKQTWTAITFLRLIWNQKGFYFWCEINRKECNYFPNLVQSNKIENIIFGEIQYKSEVYIFL